MRGAKELQRGVGSAAPTACAPKVFLYPASRPGAEACALDFNTFFAPVSGEGLAC